MQVHTLRAAGEGPGEDSEAQPPSCPQGLPRGLNKTPRRCSLSAGSLGAPTPTLRSSSFCNPRRMWLAGVGADGGFELSRLETPPPGGRCGKFKASLKELPGEAFHSWMTRSGACRCPGGRAPPRCCCLSGRRIVSHSSSRECGILHLPKGTASARYCPEVSLAHLEAL